MTRLCARPHTLRAVSPYLMSILSVCLEVAQGKGCRKHKECLTVVCEGQQVGNRREQREFDFFHPLDSFHVSERRRVSNIHVSDQ